MNKELKIRNIVKRIREVLDFFEGKAFDTVKYNPVIEFKDKKNYPLEFQIFMEEIGELYIATNGHVVFVLVEPENSEEESELYLTSYDPDNPNEKMFANDDSADSWFYDTSQAPYVFSAINYTHSGTLKDIDDGKFLDNFSEMLANQIELNLNYKSVPKIKPDLSHDPYNYIANNTDLDDIKK